MHEKALVELAYSRGRLRGESAGGRQQPHEGNLHDGAYKRAEADVRPNWEHVFNGVPATSREPNAPRLATYKVALIRELCDIATTSWAAAASKSSASGMCMLRAVSRRRWDGCRWGRVLETLPLARPARGGCSVAVGVMP